MIVAPLVTFRSVGKLFKKPTFLYGLFATGVPVTRSSIQRACVETPRQVYKHVCHAGWSVRTVISGGQLRRKGRPTVPMPRFT